MAKLTTTPLTSLTSNEASAISSINANFDAVETAMENTLSRDGTSPNTMSASIDMNSNDLLNVASIDVQSLTINGQEISASVNTLTELSDVTVSGEVTGDILRYNGTDWVNYPDSNFVDISAIALKANIASPALTGNPTAPTQTAGDNSTKIATTAYVQTAVADVVGGAIADGSVTSTKLGGDITTAGKSMVTAADAAAQTALLDATGIRTKLLTVDGAGSGIDADLLDGLSSAAFATASHTHVSADVTDLAAALALKANIAAPTFTGSARSETPPANNNSTRIATTEYVQTELGDIAVGSWDTIATLTPSAVATIEQTGLSGYKALRITGINVIPASDTTSLLIQLSSDGTNYLSSNYSAVAASISTADVASADNGSSGFRIAHSDGSTNIGNAAGDGGLDFTITISSFNTAQKTKAYGDYVFGTAAGNLAYGTLHGWHTGQTAMQAILFSFNSGNIASGTILIEGLA